MKKKVEPFLNPEQLQSKVEEWKFCADAYENGKGHAYRANRIEDNDGLDCNSVNELHGLSFIGFIRKKLKLLNPGSKLKILDIGGGIGCFTEQMRKEFGDRVRVYSTGLSKKMAKKIKDYLHKDDLKWRSVLQLSNFEEFDLIIDTYGELTYSPAYTQLKNEQAKVKGEKHVTPYECVYNYLNAIVCKLKPGGVASVKTLFQINEHISFAASTIRRKNGDTFMLDFNTVKNTILIYKYTKEEIEENRILFERENTNNQVSAALD